MANTTKGASTSHSEVAMEKAALEHREFTQDDDPHRAALEDNPEHAEKLTWTVILSALVCDLSTTLSNTHPR